MNLCNENLSDWLEKRTENSSVALTHSIAVQIVHGLKYIHEQDITHHDLKVNLFICNLQLQYLNLDF